MLGTRKRNEQEANSDEHREIAEEVHIVLDTFSSQIVPKGGAAHSDCGRNPFLVNRPPFLPLGDPIT